MRLLLFVSFPVLSYPILIKLLVCSRLVTSLPIHLLFIIHQFKFRYFGCISNITDHNDIPTARSCVCFSLLKSQSQQVKQPFLRQTHVFCPLIARCDSSTDLTNSANNPPEIGWYCTSKLQVLDQSCGHSLSKLFLLFSSWPSNVTTES